MKKFMLILIILVVIGLSATSQSLGDYRSIANGNWSDAAKWETYNGSNWISATSYPGQNPGTGMVTIMNQTEIKITGSVPHMISSLHISADSNQILPSGSLVFISENPVSLIVDGNVTVMGSMSVADQNGAKSHSLTIGGSLVAGTWTYYEWTEGCDYTCLYDYCYYPFGGYIQTISNDDALEVIFNTTKPNSSIGGARTITFQDISFNGIGISVDTYIYINGTARFMNGIVTSFCNSCDGNNICGWFWWPGSPLPPGDGGLVWFNDGATALGASVNSFVLGNVWKQGNDSFTFPIGSEFGNNRFYAPLTISAPIDAQDVFRADYGRGGGWVISDTGLHSVSDCEIWQLFPGYPSHNDNLTSSIDVTVGWSPSSGCGSSDYITNVPDVTLAHLNVNLGGWDSHGGSGEGTTTNGSVTWKEASTFGTFTLGNVNTSCVTPSAPSVTNITANSATLNWSEVPGAVSYEAYYRASDSYNWIQATTATTSINLSGLNHSTTYDWRVRTNCSSTSSSAYRQSQFTTLAPCGTPSGLTTADITFSSAALNWSAITNAINYTVEYKQSTSASWIFVATGINMLSYNLSGLLSATAYDWRVLVNCNEGTGNYAQASFTTLACIDVYETNNTSSQAKAISLGAIISANISSTTDVDWFKVTTPNNSNTQLEVTLSSLPADYDLYVYNKNLILVGSSTNTGTSSEVVIYNSNVRKATYYVKVIGKSGAYNASQCYSLLTQSYNSAGAVTNTSLPLKEIDEGLNQRLLYPNPASEFVYLDFNSATEGLVNIQIVNSIGQLVKQYPVNTINGHNQIKIHVDDIMQGMYILRINKGDLNITRKFVIAR